MTIKNDSVYFPPTRSLSTNEADQGQEISFLKSLESVSNENISMTSTASKETLIGYLFQARRNFKQNQQSHDVFIRDAQFLQELINSEQKRKPGLNIVLENSPSEFVSTIDMFRQNTLGLYRGQFIVNVGEGRHYAAFDVFIRHGNVSIIGIEPSNFDNQGPVTLMLMLLTQLKEECPSAKLVMFESNIQKSPADCAIFSLHFALKMHACKKAFDALHRDYREGKLNKHITADFIVREEVDQYLPADFMKHTNSRSRLNDYFINNSDATEISSRKDFITERQQRYICERGEKTYSASIEDKRIKLIERALRHSCP